MMVNIGSVDEETDNEAPMKTPSEATEGDDVKEEKVRVDRRKLEQMLQVIGKNEGPSAEEFFSKVMYETSTHISWPSKLKIGAKSKKDPHIKIAGQIENIKKAKEMVIGVLESKANRVTLKMDVSHTDHSHIIGRRGDSIKKVMEDTGCHIHFPDSNRGSASTEKSNQVSIAGQPEGVEKARTRIRELLPLVIMFEAPYNNAYLHMESLTPTIESIAQRYDVTFTSKGRSPIGSLVMTVRGSQDKVANIQEATGYLFKHLTGHFQLPNMVSLQFDIAPQHHVFVVGRAGCNVKYIADSTGAKIDFPDPINRKGTVTITGSFTAIIQARALLVNSLPILLMFDLKEEEASSFEDGTGKPTKLMSKFDVVIQVKPKPKQASKSVVIKTRENNSQNMYLARLEILGNLMDPFTTKHPTYSSPHSPEHPFPCLPDRWHPIGSPYPSPLASPTPSGSRTAESPVTIRSTPSPPRYPPGFEPHHRRCDSFDEDYRNRHECPRGTPASDGDPLEQFHDYPIARRYSEPTPIGESWSPRPAYLENSTRSNPSLPFNKSSSVAGQLQQYAILEGTKNAKGVQQLLDSHGSNTSSPFDSLCSSDIAFQFEQKLDLTPQKKFIDYEEQRDKATELMTRKVVQTQVRIPTDQWSGLHLSKSDGAFKKPVVKGHLDPHIIMYSTEELPEPGETAPVRQDLGKSVKNPLHFRRKGDSGLSSEQTNLNYMDPSAFKENEKGLFHLLKLYGVENFAETLERQEIDFDTFLTLTKDDLKEAGVEPLGARKKMEHAIRDMNKLQVKTIEEAYITRAAQNFHVCQPLEFNSQSGRW